MFNWFNKNKFNYEKGQLAPIFIVVLVVLIIMTFVTVNLSKVAVFKTESSNAADAGGLAAGSTMANVFNGIAQSNSQMETYYWEFYATASVSFTIATTYLIKAHLAALAAVPLATAAEVAATAAMAKATSAQALACANPCAAIALAIAANAAADLAIVKITAAIVEIENALVDMAIFTSTAWGILVAVAAFSAGQVYFYGIIRDYAEEGRDVAIKLGHKFAFMNANIGSKLKEGSPDNSIVGIDRRNNYRDIYSEFTNNLGNNDEYTYNWLDGQDRDHFVRTKVNIDPVDTFDLKVAVLPSIVEIPLLYMIINSAEAATASLAVTNSEYGIAHFTYTTASINYLIAAILLKSACVCFNCRNAGWGVGAACTACYLFLCADAAVELGAGIAANATGLAANAAGLIANGLAIGSIASIYVPLAITWAGLLPGLVFRSSNLASATPFLICWIDDVVHNRLVTINATQHHQGRDFAVWKTDYPDTNSYSVVNFTGEGAIHEPALRHDASIIETDNLGEVYDLCVDVVKNAHALETQISELNQNAATLDQRAGQIEDEAKVLLAQGQALEANELFKNATVLRDDADLRRQEAEGKAAQLENINNTNLACF